MAGALEVSWGVASIGVVIRLVNGQPKSQRGDSHGQEDPAAVKDPSRQKRSGWVVVWDGVEEHSNWRTSAQLAERPTTGRP